MRKLLLNLAGASFTSIEFWQSKTLNELKAWLEAFNEEGAEKDG